MKFNPKSERELKEEMIFPDGEYDFEVEEAKDGVSKSSGNEMVTLNLKVFDANGRVAYVRDWLVITDQPRSQMKLLKFCQTTGITSCYDDGEVTGDVCYGLTGRVLIGHQNSDDFGLQNRVVDYVPTVDQISQDVPKEYGVPAAQQKAARKAADERADARAVADANASLNASYADNEIPF